MAAKFPLTRGETNACSLMTWGFDPFISSASPYEGAYLAVVESLCRLAAAGADLKKCWLSFQEYFGKPGNDPKRWGASGRGPAGGSGCADGFWRRGHWR